MLRAEEPDKRDHGAPRDTLLLTRDRSHTRAVLDNIQASNITICT